MDDFGLSLFFQIMGIFACLLIGGFCLMVTLLKVGGMINFRRRKPIDNRRRIRVLSLAFLLLAVSAADADACSRCRRFGTACYYYKPAVVTPVVAVPSQNVYVLQNNYPAPLVGQGSSALVSNGGYQSLTLPFFDPTAYLSQSLQLVKAGQDAATLAHSQSTTLAQRIVEGQAPAVERLAAGQAASQVLKAAGLDPAHNASGTSSAVVISRDSNGQVQVLPLQAAEAQAITARLSTSTTITSSIGTTPAPQPGSEVVGLVAQHCGSCHGQQLTAPKGGFFLYDGATLTDSVYLKSKRLMESGKMPKGQPALPAETQAAILKEIDSFIPRE
jgi:hypothetical protein